MNIRPLIRVLALQCLFWPFCWADSYKALDPTSSLYTFGPGWTQIGAGVYSTTSGSVLLSFQGTNFSIPATPNPDITVTLYIDGRKQGVYGDGNVPGTILLAGDHQIVLTALAPSSNPYIFSGIAFPASDATGLNITELLPQTYGINASAVPSDAIILDNKDPCMLYEDNEPSRESHWERSSDVTTDWGSYNGSIAVPRPLWSMMTITFQGTGIWLFFSQVVLVNPGKFEGYLTIDGDSRNSFRTTILSTFTASDVALRQKLLWSYNNLTDTNHALRLLFSEVRDNQKMAIDFARVQGTPMDCRLFTAPPGNPDIRQDWTFIVITTLLGLVLLGLVSLCIFCYCFRSREKKRLRSQEKRTSDLKTPSGQSPHTQSVSLRWWFAPGISVATGADKLPKSDDNSSFASIMTHQPRSGPQVLPSDSASEYGPMATTLSQAKITPFAPEAPLSGPVDLRRDEKYAQNQVRPSGSRGSVGIPGGDVDTPSTELEMTDTTDSGASWPAGTRVNSLGGRNTLPPLNIALGDVQTNPGWSPAPPSYITELHDLPPGQQRAGERMRLLTQEDLERLVDRVTMLRGGGATRLALVDHGDIDEQPEPEDDPVELLARRIADTDAGSDATSTSVRREKAPHREFISYDYR